MKAKDFLNPGQREALVSCVRKAEMMTSGEIRIHIDNRCGEDPKEKALKTFHRLGMSQTVNKNGVLIYIASESRKFVVLGDKGINEVVPHDFWKDVSLVIAEHFATGDYVRGLEKAVLMIGEKLKAFFPYDENADVNELSDDISIADEAEKN